MDNTLAEILDHRVLQAIATVSHGCSSGQWLTKLRSEAGTLNAPKDFPVSTIRKCSAIETALSNDSSAVLRFYIWLASGCLTTAFIMTQRSAALHRIETSENEFSRTRLLASIQLGDSYATVGISHLTTSRRHLSQPPLGAVRVANGWILDGFSPWVTGGGYAEWLIVGAVEVDQVQAAAVESKPNELLFAIERNRLGVVVDPSSELMALNASATGSVRFEHVQVNARDVLHGPIPNVMEVSSRKSSLNSVAGSSGGAGGLHTSALAIGHAAQAIEYLLGESKVRSDILAVADGLQRQWKSILEELLGTERGVGSQDANALRKRSNDLALNSTQAALVAAKGVGFASNHDVGRWCREAMFFLVWSCPQSVAQAHLCSFMS